MAAGRPTRPEYDSAFFRRLWFSRVPASRIAKRYGVTPSSVYVAAKRRGFPGKHEVMQRKYESAKFRRLWFSRAPIRLIAKEYGVSTTGVHSAAMKRGFPGKLTLRATEKGLT